jgi:hypothetical protein
MYERVSRRCPPGGILKSQIVNRKSKMELAERVRIEPAPLVARICVHRDFIRMNRDDAARRRVLRQITIHARNARIRQFFSHKLS